MNYREAVDFVHAAGWTKIHLGLERIAELSRRIGNPEKDLKFIHITGTNGKGSTSAFLTAILMAEGYRVGAFTSPDLMSLNERMAIDGTPIADEDFAEIASAVAREAREMENQPSSFELLTAIALEYFRREECDVVVLEVGLGGDLDATNIVMPLVSVITGIAHDHMHILGKSLAEIATTKCGIIKSGRPVVFGGEARKVLPIISEFAMRNGSELFVGNYAEIKDQKSDLFGSRFDYKSWENVGISLLGLYQPKNAVVALETVEVLNKYGLKVSERAVYEGLLKAKWAGRFEIISKEPLIIYDGGHNEQGVRACMESVRHLFPGRKVNVLTGILANKDRGEIIRQVGEMAERIFTVRASGDERAYDSGVYAEEYLRAGYAAESCRGVKNGMEKAIRAAQENGLPILVVGSLHLYLEVIDFLTIK
ncbi:MAG: folylpolyglutamate synthase/dihydrofolate synthase family protein [Candidatus Saccharibacteria bacterium]|nr:folylpolyglutamate synthase/dihydrofolate synthase family protein [Candidatus Saccharibacteria bacterium]